MFHEYKGCYHSLLTKCNRTAVRTRRHAPRRAGCSAYDSGTLSSAGIRCNPDGWAPLCRCARVMFAPPLPFWCGRGAGAVKRRGDLDPCGHVLDKDDDCRSKDAPYPGPSQPFEAPARVSDDLTSLRCKSNMSGTGWWCKRPRTAHGSTPMLARVHNIIPEHVRTGRDAHTVPQLKSHMCFFGSTLHDQRRALAQNARVRFR